MPFYNFPNSQIITKAQEKLEGALNSVKDYFRIKKSKSKEELNSLKSYEGDQEMMFDFGEFIHENLTKSKLNKQQHANECKPLLE